jgi:ribosomal protein S18 acetylase RimI-like enzyme
MGHRDGRSAGSGGCSQGAAKRRSEIASAAQSPTARPRRLPSRGSVPAPAASYRPGVPTLIVRPGGRADVPPAAGVLGRAFQVEPVYHWLLPDPEQRRRRLPGLMRTNLRHLHTGPGACEVATRDGRIVGVAIWDAPGHRGPGALRRALALPGRIRAAGGRLDRWAEVGRRLGAAHPEQPHWYLDHLAADPGVPRCGAGSALLASGLARSDAMSVGTYLECKAENVAYYRRAGFAPHGEVTIAPGVLSVSTMWRPPPR